MVWPIIVAAGSGFGGVGPSYEAGESQSIPGSRCLNSDITVRERTRRLARAGFPTVQGQDFSAVVIRYLECCPRPLCRERCLHMKKTERVRQVVAGAVSEGEIKEQTEKGWKLVALEWEREVEAAEEKLPVEVPFGLRVSPDTRRLEEDPDERETLVQMMELIVQEGSYSKIAQELNRRGFRTREGEKWTPISVFEMLPRLIEVGPHLFRSTEWERRKQLVAR